MEAADLDEALKLVTEAVAARRALSVGLAGNAAEVYPELVRRGSPPTSYRTRPPLMISA